MDELNIKMLDRIEITQNLFVEYHGGRNKDQTVIIISCWLIFLCEVTSLTSSRQQLVVNVYNIYLHNKINIRTNAMRRISFLTYLYCHVKASYTLNTPVPACVRNKRLDEGIIQACKLKAIAIKFVIFFLGPH